MDYKILYDSCMSFTDAVKEKKTLDQKYDHVVIVPMDELDIE